MRQRSFGFDPAAIQATKSSKEPTGGLGALSWRVDIRRLVLNVRRAWATQRGLSPTLIMETRPLLWKRLAVHKPLAHWPQRQSPRVAFTRARAATAAVSARRMRG